ncbi:MAG: DMT family transporter [Elusimicrobia bacterium]|nr:DMT family transporter [Elusimicrobiota bacterium]
MNPWVWLTPTLLALFFYGIGEGLAKKYIGDVSPAWFCLCYVAAKSVVNLGFFFTRNHPPPFSAEGQEFFVLGLVACILDGIGWILFFESIVTGPISIVGTLSAAYPALTVLFARLFLSEVLLPLQYPGVLLVILGCIGLSYAPADPNAAISDKRWIPLAIAALIIWAAVHVIVKYAYGLPGASEANLSLFNVLGSLVTLGVYGFLRGRQGPHPGRGWGWSFLPTALLAGADLSVIIATRWGPVSIVTPLSGAYPLVTIAFAWMILKEKITRLQWACIAAVLAGILLATPRA